MASAENDREKKRILDAAQRQFLAGGFSRITMDAVSTALAMSKKTLYKFFESKDALLLAVVHRLIEGVAVRIQEVMDAPGLDAMAKMDRLLKIVGAQLSRFNRPFIADVQRTAPHIWEEVSTFRRSMVLSHFGILFEEARKQGMVRTDINPELLLHLYLTTVENIINPYVLAELPVSAEQAFETLISVFFNGVLTDKGRRTRNAVAGTGQGGVR